MTPEQRYDRLERIARLICEASSRSLRESRRETAKLKVYVAALKEHDAAELAARETPEDAERTEGLRRATERLALAREELKHLIRNFSLSGQGVLRR